MAQAEMLLASTTYAEESPSGAGQPAADHATGALRPRPVPSLPLPDPSTVAPRPVPDLVLAHERPAPGPPEARRAATRPVSLDDLTSTGTGPAPSRWLPLGWALLPLVTVGLATPVCFAYAAVRQHRRRLVAFTALYAVLVATSVALTVGGEAAPGLLLPAVSLALVVAVGGTVHALAIRRSVFAPTSPYRRLTRTTQERMRRREESRRIVTADPALAERLGIGRPDLPGAYDDGGLIDVNHVPLRYIAHIDGVDETTARQIVETRQSIGGFRSLEELCMATGLWPQDIGAATARLIFIR